ncbi:CBS domain-containing protein [Geobacter pelophilus]|jgi:CBS domain-containing protein/sporulation protein YlmC with PRC-barrel domain|uniref:CBS domain-containing protein n=1 Tax=Geoanaerobacter pelophilus TaxID=60036 RepID=A0AAW4L2A9_9BACT|nr:CBS domain-containing protein [Geoanaerobacter pelophilus]MBT0662770.1 CBS domain-containing protein [Geoanaerobacter pelophilus]
MNVIIGELFISSLLGKNAINDLGQDIGKLIDLVMVPGETFPIVSHIILKNRRGLCSASWEQISLFNRAVISVSMETADSLPLHTDADGEIFIKRDILDKQIVDVDGAKVVRVNDVKLGRFNDLLCIFSVDIGFRGLLRRLGYERFGDSIAGILKQQIPDNEISWQFVQPLEMHTSRLALTVARDQMKELHPADLADIIEQIPVTNIQTVLNTIDSETAGDTLYELEPEFRTKLIEQLGSEQASDILEEMAPDEAADVLADLPEEKAQELLGLMEADEAEEIQELMEHEEDSAGGFMNSEFLSIAGDMTIEDALRQVRLVAPDIDTVYYAYVLDDEDRLEGVVSLKDLLVTPANTVISELMEDNLKTVQVNSEPEEIYHLMTKYNLLAIPVLDEEGRMAGIVTVDDILQHFLPHLVRRKRHMYH